MEKLTFTEKEKKSLVEIFQLRGIKVTFQGDSIELKKGEKKITKPAQEMIKSIRVFK
jgi:hypothetical protein